MDHEQSTRPVRPAGDPAGAPSTILVAVALLVGPPLALPDTQSFPALWTSMVAGSFGALMGACAWRERGPAALALSLCAALPGLVAVVLDRAFMKGLASPWGALGAMCGLGLAGAAMGAWAARADRSVSALAAWLLLLAGLGAGAAAGWGLLGAPPAFDPAMTAFMLDLSPHGFVLECGGVDWMRSSFLYEAAGTDRIGPELRSSWSGSVAGPVLVVVGCTGLVAARVRR